MTPVNLMVICVGTGMQGGTAPNDFVGGRGE